MIEGLRIVFVDDDADDHFIFKKTLKEMGVSPELTILDNGEKLMEYLSKNLKQLPNVIFLDLNMPRKNGSECLTEIKHNKKLKDIPVIIYSTSFHHDILDLLYKCGAYHCIRKNTSNNETRKNIQYALQSVSSNKLIRPVREKFVLGTI
jgi:CheY-like chemotaxis protein